MLSRFHRISFTHRAPTTEVAQSSFSADEVIASLVESAQDLPGQSVGNSLEINSPHDRRITASYPQKLRHIWGDAILEELHALSAEPNRLFFCEGLQRIAERLFAEGRSQLALLLHRTLESLGYASPGFRARAEFLEGRGDRLSRLESFSRELIHQAADPAMIAGMGVGGLLYRGTRLALLARLSSSSILPSALSSGWAGRLLASAGGLAVEVPGFTAATHVARHVLGSEAGGNSLGDLMRELRGNALLSTGMRMAGGIAAILPPALRQGVFGLATSQGLLLGAIAATQSLEGRLGWREGRGDPLVEALATYLHLQVGGRVAHSVLGSAFSNAERSLDLRAEGLQHAMRLPNRWGAALRDIALTPMWWMMGAGGMGGGFRWSRGRDLLLGESLRGFAANFDRIAEESNPLNVNGERIGKMLAEFAETLMKNATPETRTIYWSEIMVRHPQQIPSMIRHYSRRGSPFRGGFFYDFFSTLLSITSRKSLGNRAMEESLGWIGGEIRVPQEFEEFYTQLQALRSAGHLEDAGYLYIMDRALESMKGFSSEDHEIFAPIFLDLVNSETNNLKSWIELGQEIPESRFANLLGVAYRSREYFSGDYAPSFNSAYYKVFDIVELRYPGSTTPGRGNLLGNAILQRDRVGNNYIVPNETSEYQRIPCMQGRPITFGLNGRINSAILGSPATIQGISLPEGSSVSFMPNGRLSSFISPESIRVNGIYIFPQREVSLHGNGYPEELRLAANTVIQGIPYLAREDNPVLFHSNGRLRQGRMMSPQEIDDIPCEAGVIEFHDNGRLSLATLARDINFRGLIFEARSQIRLHPNGSLDRYWPRENQVIQGFPCLGALLRPVLFHENGRVKRLTLSRNFRVEGTLYPANTVLNFNPDGSLER